MPRGPMVVGSREDSGQMIAKQDINTSNSPSLNSTTFSSSMAGAGTLGTTDYFPGVIDTSKSHYMGASD